MTDPIDDMEAMESVRRSKYVARTKDLGRGVLAIVEHPCNDQTQTPPATRSALSVLADGSQAPMSTSKAIDSRRKIIEEIGTARIHHSSILEKSLLQSQPDAIAFAAMTHPALHCGPRWVDIQSTYRLEKDLAADFFTLLGKMVDVWEKESRQHNRKIHEVVDTHAMVIRNDRNSKNALRPDLFVRGTSSLFPSHSNPGKTPDWCSCVAVGEAKLHQGRNKMDTFGQLGTYAEQVFSAQENRRFLQTFYFDDLHLVWCTFDRGGAVTGDAVDYHRDPWKLCALVLHFLFEGKDLGLDPTIRYKDGFTLISTTPPPEIGGDAGEETCLRIPNATYVVRRTLFQSTNIQGNGAIYWFVQRHDPRSEDEESWCIIKDTWVVNGCEFERGVYDWIGSALMQDTGQGDLRQGVFSNGQGIAPLLFTHNVLFAGRIDSVSMNRPPGVNTPSEDDRIHTRAIFRTTAGAKLLDHFGSTLELLVAVRDAVQGHRQLQSHGILHKNITPYRILIQPDAQEGDRGVLLDYASSSTDSSSLTRGVEGSRAFYSRGFAKALAKGEPFTHSYLDDLESFFYVLAYLVVCYPATGSLKPKSIPRDVSDWFGSLGGWTGKSIMMLERTCPFPIDDSFEPPVSQLVNSLHCFFRESTLQTERFDSNWRSEPAQAYDNFLGHLDDAIDGLRIYELDGMSLPESNSQNFLTVLGPIHDVTGDEAPLYQKNSNATDHLRRGSTSTIVHCQSQHPSSTRHGAGERPDKRKRTPSPGSSKRIRLDDHQEV